MGYVAIDSIYDERLVPYIQLTNHELRNTLEPERGLLIAESETVVRVALQSGLTPISFLIETRWKNQFEERLLPYVGFDIDVFCLEHEQMKQLTGYYITRGVLCAMRRPTLMSVGDVLTSAKQLAVLEGISDTTNIGALARSAAALGIDALLLAPNSADPYTRRAIRVSMGTIFQLQLARFEQDVWPQIASQLLRDAGFCSIALALTDDALALSHPQLAAHQKYAFFFGAEGDGLSKETIASCDYVAKIPMAGTVDSLNVASAAALSFWELVARKQSS